MSADLVQRKLFRSILKAIVAEEYSTEDYKVALQDLRSGLLTEVLDNVMSVLCGEVPKTGKVAPGQTGDDAKETRAENRRQANTDERSRSSRKKNGDQDQVSADDLFNDLRRRKIPRQMVESYISSLNRGFAQKFDQFGTTRLLLHGYKEEASLREWELLRSLINGDYERDPYLQRIVAG